MTPPILANNQRAAVWPSFAAMLLLTIVHAGSICTTFATAVVIGIERDKWGLSGVTFGFGILDLTVAILIGLCVVVRTRQC